MNHGEFAHQEGVGEGLALHVAERYRADALLEVPHGQERLDQEVVVRHRVLVPHLQHQRAQLGHVDAERGRGPRGALPDRVESVVVDEVRLESGSASK